MDTSTLPSPTDPVALVRNLNAETIRERIAELDREREALVILLRAAVRAERPRKEVAGAH